MKSLSTFLKTAVLCVLLMGNSRHNCYAQPGMPAILTAGQGAADYCRDQFGNSYMLGGLLINDTLRGQFSDSIISLTISTASSGYFQLYLEPGCGMENFASNIDHLRRLNVVSKVLSDLSAFINSPCSGTGQKINIWVRNNGGVNYPYSNDYPAVGISFYNIASDNTKSGIADNAIWTTMQSGIDAYSNLTGHLFPNSATYGNGNTFFHGMLAINFDSLIHWDTSLTTAPANNIHAYDLYTVTLREMIHALGFVSLIDSNGNSVFGASSSYFSRYDLNLQKQNGTKLLSHSGSISMYNYSFNSSLSTSVLKPNTSICLTDFTDHASAIVYAGGLSTPQPVYTPNCWEPGMSLSHFEDMYIADSNVLPAYQNNGYFVMSNRTNPGNQNNAMKRFPTASERQVLADIGYSVNTTFGSGSSLNYINYGGSVSSGLGVVGINDGLDSDGNYTLVADSTGIITINGSDLLGNDAGMGGGSFEGLELIGGSAMGTLSATSGTYSSVITFTPASGTKGAIMLRYVPVSATGARGSAAKVTTLNNQPCTSTFNSCNIVPNGGFETGTSSCGDPAVAGTGCNATIGCWNILVPSPDLFSAGCGTPCVNTGPVTDYSVPTTCTAPSTTYWAGSPSTNNHFVGVYGEIAPAGKYHPGDPAESWFGEGYQVQIFPMVGGQHYSFDAYAKVLSPIANAWNILLNNKTGHIKFGFNKTPIPIVNGLGTGATLAGLPASCVFPLPAFAVTPSALPLQANGDQNWIHLHVNNFTMPGPATTTYNTLFFYNDVKDNGTTGYPVDYAQYIFVDDINIQPVYTSFNFNPPANWGLCTGTMNNLMQYVSPAATSGSFSGPGVTGSGTSWSFTPPAAGSYTIVYSYTTPCGITMTSPATINVISNTPVITSSIPCTPPQVLQGQQFTLSAASCSPCTWNASSGNAVSPLIGATTTATQNGTGTATYTATDGASGCPATFQVSLLTVGITSSAPKACVGGTVTLSAHLSSSCTVSYTYKWYLNGILITGPGATASSYTTPAYTLAGNYTYTVLAYSGSASTAVSPGVTIQVYNNPVATITGYSPNPFCAGVGNSITLFGSTTATGGPYVFNWSPPGIGITSNSNTSTFSYTGSILPSSQVFTLFVTDGHGCTSANTSITVPIYTQPIVSIGGPQSNYCAGSPAPLVATVSPAGSYTFQWYLNGAAVGSPTTSNTYSTTVAGSYSVKATNTATGCTGTSAATQVSFVNYNSCCPNSTFNTGNYQYYNVATLSNVSIGAFLTPLVFITNTSGPIVTLSGNVNFSGVTVLVDAGITLQVAAGANVNVTGCHFLSCGMWQGFSMGSYNSTLTIGPSSSSNSLIEDAVAGVKISGLTLPFAGNGLTVKNAAFNRCNTGIEIDNYNFNTGGAYAGIKITNSIFTSRNLYPVPTSSTVWPVLGAWINNLGNGWAPANANLAPYKINDASSYGVSSTCHTGYALYGINLNGVGSSLTAPAYTWAMIGVSQATAPGVNNIFDNLGEGIHATNANFECDQNIFMNIHSVSTAKGDGVYATLPNGMTAYGKILYGNFWECQRAGAEIYDYSTFTGQYCKVVGNQAYPSVGSPATNYGFYLSTGSITDIELNNNFIYNTWSGINITGTAFWGTGMLNIEHNNINANYTGSYAALSAFCDNAITLQSQFAYTAATTASVTIGGNTITDVFRGIGMINFGTLPALVQANQVSLKPDQASAPAAQYAIENKSGSAMTINCNVINGSTGTFATNQLDKVRGVFDYMGANTIVTQNTETSVGRGFDFELTKGGVRWMWNSMADNAKGLSLDLGAFLGMAFPLNGPAGMNVWQTTSSWSTSLNFQTWVNFPLVTNTAFQSPLNIMGAPNQIPVNNFNSSAPAGNFYDASVTAINTPPSGLFFGTASPTPSACPSPDSWTKSVANKVAIARNHIDFGSNAVLSAWMAQLALYNELSADTSTLDSALVLPDFVTTASASRLGFLRRIENYLAAGDYAAAQSLLSSAGSIGSFYLSAPGTLYGSAGAEVADLSFDDNIVSNYLTFYQVYLDYMTASFTGPDIEALNTLVNMCPNIDGAVVIQARVLYCTINKDLTLWDDDACPGTAGEGGKANPAKVNSINTVTDQDYSIYPNPSNGTITLKQAQTDNDPVKLELMDAKGSVLFKGVLQFNRRKAPFTLQQAIPGLYFLQLSDSKGKTYSLKFVINQ